MDGISKELHRRIILSVLLFLIKLIAFLINRLLINTQMISLIPYVFSVLIIVFYLMSRVTRQIILDFYGILNFLRISCILIRLIILLIVIGREPQVVYFT